MNNIKKIKIGITGQSGFIGSHLYNELGLDPEKYERILFKDDYFIRSELLNTFVRQCDVIVHLAAVNRHPYLEELYNTNVELVKTLIKAMLHENVRPHIFFSSSIQEDYDNPYGKSKREGCRLFEEWAHKYSASFTCMVIPNVFGPFGLPNHNSFISTFCHKLTHNEKPEIVNDTEVNLIYVSTLCRQIKSNIDDAINYAHQAISKKIIQPDFTKKVSEILTLLHIFKGQYFEQGTIPYISDFNDINLFNTFRSYIDLENYFPFALKKNVDERGTFVETIKLRIGGQVSFSTTNPGFTRGNHYHIRKIERFTVIKGKALIQLRQVGTEKIFSFYLNGENPSHIDMPVWFTHNITNIGKDDLYTQFWVNEWYDSANPDTFFEKVEIEKT